jgi:hypothetical protein
VIDLRRPDAGNPTLEVIFCKAHRQLRPRTPLPEIKIEFFPFAGLNHTARLRDNRLRVRVSDLFTDAPPEVYHSLALILLAKLYRKKIDQVHHQAYRTFILTDLLQERARLARARRCRSARAGSSQGCSVDLNPIFDRLNEGYFGNALEKPRLSWSPKKTRYILGRFDVTHNVIFVSRVFDAPDIPMFVIEYILFHEMLHVKHHSQIRHSRLAVHTPEFKRDEKQFPHYEAARRWLKHLG